MLVGYTFNKQLFTSESFAKFQDVFLGGHSGIIDGCTLSKTTNSVSIEDGWFLIKGRLLREQGGTTLNPTNDGYYIIVCEIDLTKENTETSLLQAELKLISNASAYPTLVQQDLNNGGTVYQYEFARFKLTSGSITDFTDKRTSLDFESIYESIDTTVQALIDVLEQKIEDLEDGSAYVFKNNIQVITGEIFVNANTEYTKDINFPAGFNPENCIVISIGAAANTTSMSGIHTGLQFGSNSTNRIGNTLYNLSANFYDDESGVTDKFFIRGKNIDTQSYMLSYKIALMKI